MDRSTLELWLALIGTGCWVVCFWWMGRISAKQNYLMDRLREQGQRIERFSKVEHDLIKEVHPQVGEIKDGMAEVMAAVKENSAEIASVKENTENQTAVAATDFNSRPAPKPARQKDDKADQEDYTKAAAAIGGAAPVETAAAKQEE